MLSRILFALAILATAAPALAQDRFALLIANQDYNRAVGRLANPINDVNLIAGSLRKIGFAKRNIRIVRNASRRQILRAIDAHAEALKAAGPNAVGFLYYSGHGAANKRDKRNYLIPADVKRLDSGVWYDAIPLDGIVATLSDLATNAAHFVVFDACRNLLNMPTKGAKGFVPVQSRRGMLIAFSTVPGETASDDGRNSGPYAAALAAELVKPGLHHLDLFQNVKEAVYRRTKMQVPWTRDGMLERVYLNGKKAKAKKPEIDPAAHDWQFVKDSKNLTALRAFAKRYNGTVFADMALAMADQRTANIDLPKTGPAVLPAKSKLPSTTNSELQAIVAPKGFTICEITKTTKNLDDGPVLKEEFISGEKVCVESEDVALVKKQYGAERGFLQDVFNCPSVGKPKSLGYTIGVLLRCP